VNCTVVTRAPERDRGIFTAGLDLVFGPRARLHADVTAQLLSAGRVGPSVSF